jgi:hypothetical protein
MRARALLTVLVAMGVRPVSGSDLPILAPDSPFGINAGHETPGAGPQPFELRGIMETPDGMRFCIYDTERHASTWAAIGEAGNPFLIVSAGSDLNRVTLERNGRVVALTLKESKVLAAPPLATSPEAITQPEVVVHSGRGRQPGDVRAPGASNR